MSVIMSPNGDAVRDIIEAKRQGFYDIVARAEDIVPIISDEGDLYLRAAKSGETKTSLLIPSAESQYLSRIEVPGQFFHRCPATLKRDILGHFHRNRGFTLRCIQPPPLAPVDAVGSIRAVLGPQFPTDRDDHILFPIILEALDIPNISLASFSWDPHVSQLMVLFTDTSVNMDGEPVQGSIAITNSETGHSSLWIEPSIKIFGDMWLSNRYGDNGMSAARFVHRGTLPTVQELRDAIEKAKRIAQIGVIQYLENAKATVSAKAATAYLEDLTVLPRRFANIIADELKTAEFIQKTDLMRRILQVSRELPLIQELQIRREAGRFVGLFENTAGRMAHLIAQINND